MTTETLKAYTVKDLAQMAKDRGVRGWQSMRKEQLVRALSRSAGKAARAAAPAKSAAGRGASARTAAKRTPAKSSAAKSGKTSPTKARVAKARGEKPASAKSSAARSSAARSAKAPSAKSSASKASAKAPAAKSTAKASGKSAAQRGKSPAKARTSAARPAKSAARRKPASRATAPAAGASRSVSRSAARAAKPSTVKPSTKALAAKTAAPKTSAPQAVAANNNKTLAAKTLATTAMHAAETQVSRSAKPASMKPAKVEAHKPELRKPELRKSEPRKPEAAKVEVRKPEAVKPTAAVKPTQVKLEVRKPEAVKPAPVVKAPEPRPKTPAQQRHLNQLKEQYERTMNLAYRQTTDAAAPPRDRLVVMVRDPYWLQAYWELTRSAVQRAEAALGSDWHMAKPVLRLLEISNHGASTSAETVVRSITIHGGVNNWYVDVKDPPKTYRMDVGYQAQNGKFFSLARSNIVSTPRPGMGEGVDENWSDVAQQCDKIYAMSGGYAAEGPPTELQELFEERLRRPMGAALSNGGLLLPGGRKKKEFSFTLDAKLMVYGTTDPSARVTLQGDPVQLQPDGSFRMIFNLPDSRQIIPAVARSADGAEQRTIVLAVERNTKAMEPLIRENGDD